MKNPNGYGTIRKLSGNRRKPWAVLAPMTDNGYSLEKQRKLRDPGGSNGCTRRLA